MCFNKFILFLLTDFDYYYKLIRSSKKEYIETGYAAKKFLNHEFREKYKVFQRYIAAADDARTMLSERAQDPDWFEGLTIYLLTLTNLYHMVLEYIRYIKRKHAVFSVFFLYGVIVKFKFFRFRNF